MNETTDCIRAVLAADNARLMKINAELLAALELPFSWEAEFGGDYGGNKSDQLLKAHGWDCRCSPEEFMRKYARAAIAKAKQP